MLPICLLLAGGGVSSYELGKSAYSRDDLSTAEAYLRQARKENGQSFDVYFLLGATLVRMNRHDEAIRELKAAHGLRPRHGDAAKLLAIELMNTGRTFDALEVLQPIPEAARDEELWLLLIEANQDAGSVDATAGLVRHSLARHPGSARLNAWMGFALRETGQFGDAQIFLKKALQADPASQAANYLLGDVLLRSERYRQALPWFLKAIEADSGDSEAIIGLSRALAGTGKPEEALKEIEAAFGRSPGDGRLALELSRQYARLGEKDKARAMAERAASLRDTGTRTPESLRQYRSGQ